MKVFHGIVVALIIIGALNWGLVGLFDFNLVSTIFGIDSWASNLIYILVGISGIVAIFTEFALHGGLKPSTERATANRPATQS